jgi:hypothetical protein
MLGQSPFYHNCIKKYNQLFGTLFNDITIERVQSNGSISKIIKVPISYAAKDKVLLRTDQEPDVTGKQVAFQAPAMSFQIVDMKPDGTRKLDTLGRLSYTASDKNYKSSVYNPVPWNIDYNLYIYVKNTEDGTKIVEQILPFFTPDYTPRVELFSEANVAPIHDIPIWLNTVEVEEDYYGAFTNQKTIVWTLSFTLMGYFYGPVKKIPVIKFANVGLYIANAEVSPLTINTSGLAGHVTVQPGMDANGNPTDNVSITIPYANIAANDNWTYIVLEYDDLPEDT